MKSNLKHAMAQQIPVIVLESALQLLMSQESVPLSPGSSAAGFCAAAAVAYAAGDILGSPECKQILDRAMTEGDKSLLADAFNAAGLPPQLALQMLHTNDILDAATRKACLIDLFDDAIQYDVQ